MSELRFGPVEIYLIGFNSATPDAETLESLSDLLDFGVLRLLDLVMVEKDEDHYLAFQEFDGGHQALGLDFDLEETTKGLISDEDLQELAYAMPAGSSALAVAVELAFARDFVYQLSQAGGEMLRTERIPAPVVNALVDLSEQISNIEGGQ